MGYNTFFEGQISVQPPLNEHEISFLRDYQNNTRHTDPDAGVLVINDGLRGNTPQHGRPSIWLHWLPTDDGEALEWDGGEKTYDHAEWLTWLIDHLLGPASRQFVAAHLSDDERLQHFTHDHVLNGFVTAYGEGSGDIWAIRASNNIVQSQPATISFEQKPAPLRSKGIHLDAESLRAELNDAPEAHDLDPADAELIANLDDDQINQAIDQEINDEFWAQYDNARRRAIFNLAEKLGIERQ